MNSDLTIIPDSLLTSIGGAHIPTSIGAFTAFCIILEAPHVFMGIREFTNYSIDRWQHGCSQLDEGDHFTAFFCKALTNEK